MPSRPCAPPPTRSSPRWTRPASHLRSSASSVKLNELGIAQGYPIDYNDGRSTAGSGRVELFEPSCRPEGAWLLRVYRESEQLRPMGMEIVIKRPESGMDPGLRREAETFLARLAHRPQTFGSYIQLH